MPRFKMNIARAEWAFTHDLIMTALAYVLALYMRVPETLLTDYLWALVYGLPLVLVIAAVTYRLFGLYRGIWRYASSNDLVQITKAATVTTLAFVLVMFLLTRLDLFPRSVPPILWFVLLVLLGGPRFAYRLFKDHRMAQHNAQSRAERVQVLLVGASDAADLFIRHVASDPLAGYQVVGVIDDKGRRVGRLLNGVPVLGTLDDLEAVLKTLKDRGFRPQRLILTRQGSELEQGQLKQIFAEAERLGLTLGRLPSLTEFKDALITGKVEFRPVAVEDLLGRPQAALDRDAIADLVTGRTVLVTGSGGTIGSELCRQIVDLKPRRLVLLDNGEFNLYTIDLKIREQDPALPCRPVLCDVRDREGVFRVFQEERPDLVFHAAALKHVPMVEMHPCEGALTNTLGTRNVADAARAVATRAMVLVSTDKAIRPTNVMGATKRAAEAYCQALDMEIARTRRDGAQQDGAETTRFMTVRFGNVLGSTGSVVPLFQRQLERGGPLTVTHADMRRYFMTVREAVELVLQASAYGVRHTGDRGKIFVLDMGEPIRIVDVARQMIRLAGLRPDTDVKIEFVGLRPGEKLFEEMFDAAESPTRIESQSFFLASPRLIDYALLNRAVSELETAARGANVEKVKAILGNIVPEYDRPAATPAATPATPQVGLHS